MYRVSIDVKYLQHTPLTHPNTTYPGPNLGSGGLWIIVNLFDIFWYYIHAVRWEKAPDCAYEAHLDLGKSGYLYRIQTVPGPDPWLEELAVVKCWCLHTWESLSAGVVSRKANEKSKFIQTVPHWIWEVPMGTPNFRDFWSHPTGKWVSPCSSKRTIWEECTASFSIIAWGGKLLGCTSQSKWLIHVNPI